MDIYRLRTFVAVARYGHLTRASQAVHLSQPTVSGQIKALEDELGVQLFERTPHGMLLTAWGKKVLSTANTVLTAIDTLVEQAQADSRKCSSKIRIGTIIHPSFLRLGEISVATRKERPEVELELHHSLAGAILNAVQKRELEAGFFMGTPKRAGIGAVRLRQVGLCVIGPSKWIADPRRIDAGELSRLPWIIQPKSGAYRQLSMRLFKKYGIDPARVIEADRESTLIDLVSSGLGLSLIREEALSADVLEKQDMVRLDATIATDLYFIYLSARQNDPSMQALIHAVREVWHAG